MKGISEFPNFFIFDKMQSENPIKKNRADEREKYIKNLYRSVTSISLYDRTTTIMNHAKKESSKILEKK